MMYISGSITNDPHHMERFAKAEEILSEKGFTVFNPTRNVFLFPRMKGKYSWYMDLSLVELSWCDSICMLEGWAISTGAKLEYEYARAHNYNIYFLVGNRVLKQSDLQKLS